MQRWTLDTASLVSFALVVAASAALPTPVALGLAAAEVAFAASLALRFSAHGAPRSPTGARRWLLPLLGGWRASGEGSGDGDALDSELHPEHIASKLLDEKEGHLPLLRGGHLLCQWFHGLTGPHQLQPAHVTQLLSFLTTGHLAVHAAAAATHLPAGPALPYAAHPQLHSWAARLMQMLHLAHSMQDEELEPETSATPTSSLDEDHAPAAAAAASAAAAAAASPAKLFAASADPLAASYRPLAFYLLTEAIAAASHLALTALGFACHATPSRAASVYVWSPPGGADQEDEEPLVFLHGIGLGLAPYIRLLGRLVAAVAGRRRVFAVQYKHVSMRLTSRIPAPHEVASDVAAFLVARGVKSASLLAHSYGTLIASALVKLAAASPAAPAVSRLTLVDPVCFAMFLPHLVRNAIYQQPVEPTPSASAPASSPAGSPPASPSSPRGGSLARSVLKGLVTAEFHCSVALRRRLDWARVNLWPSELPAACSVVLSGRDNLVPVQEIREILANRASMLGPSVPHPTVLYNAELGHGGFLINAEWQEAVVAAAVPGAAPAAAPEPAATAAAAAAAATAELEAVLAAARVPPPAPALSSLPAPLAAPVAAAGALALVLTMILGRGDASHLGAASDALSSGGDAGSGVGSLWGGAWAPLEALLALVGGLGAGQAQKHGQGLGHGPKLSPRRRPRRRQPAAACEQLCGCHTPCPAPDLCVAAIASAVATAAGAGPGPSTAAAPAAPVAAVGGSASPGFRARAFVPSPRPRPVSPAPRRRSVVTGPSGPTGVLTPSLAALRSARATRPSAVYSQLRR
ncbi:hypothetical protein HYH03_005677 [Edaphochlamys debaryana]|uniref:AB hydrolase-1 domain-containing protein n=1 Tax=Edaphochlamys debaryana TaxID=47281 RepID=A0A836C298_9CHLO|nr:hypothetical protein HYH03_005677 [Edaphochlamys debaryana]|eukprot:KAG2496453.1 hypothetical protein HYH03_005677 [Edaphochlamys debaryana]